MGELIRSIKMQPTIYEEMECDAQADYTYILGDFNYRIDSTFEHLAANIGEALSIPEKE